MPADLVLRGASIVTMAGQDVPLRPGAVAIADGRIVAVDAEETIRSLIDDRTQVLDLQGRTVLPGFFDTHVHFIQTGLSLVEPDLSECKSARQVIDKIRDFVLDGGNSPLFFHRCRLAELGSRLTRRELDRIAPGRLVGVGDFELHGCVVNSAAMRTMRLPSETPGILLSADGWPDGHLIGAAHTIARSYFYDRMDDDVRRLAITRACDVALRAGVTTVHAIEGRESFGSRDLPMLLSERDKLPIRLVLYGQSNDLSRASAPGIQGIADLWADGAYTDHSAALLEPYADDPGNSGTLNYSDGEMFDLVRRTYERGLQVSFHAVGDAAIEQVLRTYERLQAVSPGFAASRPRIEHFSLASDEQITRAAQIGVGVAMQPAMSAGAQPTVARRVGAERARRRHAYRKIVDAGLLVAGGSDSDVTPICPLGGIHAIVNQTEPSRKLTVMEALALFTVNGAKIACEEDEKGTIEPGKVADLVVLGANPLSVAPGEIGSIPIEMTIVGGRVRWERPGAGANPA